MGLNICFSKYDENYDALDCNDHPDWDCINHNKIDDKIYELYDFLGYDRLIFHKKDNEYFKFKNHDITNIIIELMSISQDSKNRLKNLVELDRNNPDYWISFG